MWKDTREERLKRYLDCLKKNPDLFQPYVYNRENEKESSMEKRDFLFREHQETFQNVCDYVLAPSLNAYVLWVLREAIASGKKRLYFLARDGYLMYRTAQIYCRKFHLPVQCCYLCCSRYSIRIPMFHLNRKEAMDYICRGGIDVNLHKILNRAGLNEKEQFEVVDALGMVGQAKEPIPYAQIPKIRKRLEQCELFQEYVIRHSKEAMPNFIGYLTQEGLLDGVPCALVDSGWVGSMQKVLNQVISFIRETSGNMKETSGNMREMSGDEEIIPGDMEETSDSRSAGCNKTPAGLEGYYWGLYELPAGVRAADYHCFYFSPGDHLKEKVYFSNCLFEGVFSAPHGMTMGYENEGGYFRPIFSSIPVSHRKVMQATERRVLAYTERKAEAMLEEWYEKDRSWNDDSFSEGYSCLEEYLAQMDERKNRRTVHQLLKLFMGEPTRQEAELFGKLHFSDDVLEEDGQQMAVEMSQQELKDNHVGNKILTMLGIKKGHVKESAWYEGSAVRSEQNVERHLRRYAGYKYLLYFRKKRIWNKRQDGSVSIQKEMKLE